MQRVNESDPAIIAEAARWGDSKVNPPRNKTHLADGNQLAHEHVFPRHAAISCSTSCGPTGCTRRLPPGIQPARRAGASRIISSAISGRGGTIYYTTDGVTDPR